MIKIVTAVLVIIIAATILSPLLTSYDPEAISLDELRQPPSLKHLFGTDNKGRDIFSRVLFGGRISISVAVIAAAVSMVIGLIVGLVSGFVGGRTDTFLMTFTDFVLSFPSLLLAIGISILLPPGISTVMLALAVVGWASFARLIRGHVLSVREAPFIEAARALGCSRKRILFVHLLPQCLPLALVMTGVKLGGYILTEASLSFLGLGVQPPAPSWGSMVSSYRVFLVSDPWMVIFPGFAIALTSLCCNLLGDALRDSYNVRMTGERKAIAL